MKTEIQFNKLMGENVSYIHPLENGEILSLCGKVVDLKPEKEGAGLDAAIAFEAGQVRTCMELSWEAVSYGEFSLIKDGHETPIDITDLDVGVPSYANGIAMVEFVFRIDDPDQIKESFDKPVKRLKGQDLADSMLAAFSSDPFGVGSYTIDLRIVGDNMMALLTAEITDAALLHTKVSQAGRAAGRDSDYEPVSAADALYEAFLGANDASSILDYGFEMVTARDPKDATEVNAA